MLWHVTKFTEDESGAITVDWIVLTAAIVGLGIAVLTTFGQGTVAHAELAGDTMTEQGIPTY